MTDDLIQAPVPDPHSDQPQNRALRFILDATVWTAWILFGLVCSMALFSYWKGLGPYETWHTLGPVQVLGGPEHVWVFAEEITRLAHPGSSDAPAITLGRRQVAIVFDANGVKERIPIPDGGPVFSTNIGRIFRQADGFYLIQGQSAGYKRSMYRWSKNQFELLPLEQSEAWLQENGLGTNALPEFDPIIDKITASNGWEHLHSEHSPSRSKEGTFTWKKIDLRFQIERSTMSEYRLVSEGSDKPLVIPLFTVDSVRRKITRQEADDLLRHTPTGHPDPY